MRRARFGLFRWVEKTWNLPWRLKGAFLGAPILVIALAVTLSVVVATGGDGGSAEGGVAQAPSPAATITPSPTSTPTPKPTAKPMSSPTPAPLPTQAQSPAPAAEPALTSAEVIGCEGGESDGWDDAFNLRPHGFTPFPAPLKLTTDPAACEDLWLAAYDDGYFRGTNDKCSIVSDYIEVATTGELEFCGLEPPPAPPVWPPHPLLDSETAILFAKGWMLGDADATVRLAVANPPIHYSELEAAGAACQAEYDPNMIWWAVVCQAQEYACILEGIIIWCPTYSVKLCVSDIEPFDVFAPC